jgi:hypothetical protein
VAAELVQRRMTAGRHQPLLLHVRTEASDAPMQCVVKPVNRLTMPPMEYLLEWTASAIAAAMGIETPEPLAVEIDEDFAAAVSNEFRADVRSSIGLAFGSTFVANHTQLPADHALSPDQKEAAARLLAFDVFIHNPDRRAGNQNLFLARSKLLAFDHEQAFSFLLPLLGTADPAVDPALDIVQRHVLSMFLKGKMPSLEGFRSNLESLDDAFFSELRRATPVEWTVGQASGKLDTIVEVLQKRRDAVDRWLPQVQAWLER